MLHTGLNNLIKVIVAIIMACLAAGCATTQVSYGDPDPYEPVNRVSYDFTETIDKALIKPIAEIYVDVTPELMRTGITNFFDNLAYLNVILNSFLQGKFDQGLSDSTRFIFNSTIGLAGLVDVATPMGLPEHNEDFGQTLAVWGAGQGAFLYIPVSGPNTARDLPDMATSTFTNPLFYISGVFWPLTVVDIINKRANLIEATEIRDEAAVDPYIFTREAYIQKRRYLIYDGAPPVEGYDDIFENAGEGENAGTLVIE
jgi:phospholipid-binding lipoprotein MlaA